MQQTSTVVTKAARKAIVRGAGEGAPLAIPPGALNVTVSLDESNGTLEVLTATLKPGMGTPVHAHRAFDEVLYVLEGSLTVLLDGEKAELGPGASVLVPATLVHAYKNAGSVTAKYLQITALGGMETFLAAFAADPSQPFERLIAIADAQGTDILAPPF